MINVANIELAEGTKPWHTIQLNVYGKPVIAFVHNNQILLPQDMQDQGQAVHAQVTQAVVDVLDTAGVTRVCEKCGALIGAGNECFFCFLQQITPPSPVPHIQELGVEETDLFGCEDVE